MTQTANRPLAAPEPNPETQAFWDAAREGKLMLGYCRGTQQYFYYPRALSPFTLTDDVELREAKGTGSIYSLSVMRRGKDTPYVLAYVTLDEGPSVMTNIVECDPDTLAIGDRVEVIFTPTEGGPPVPFFKPAAR